MAKRNRKSITSFVDLANETDEVSFKDDKKEEKKQNEPENKEKNNDNDKNKDIDTTQQKEKPDQKEKSKNETSTKESPKQEEKQEGKEMNSESAIEQDTKDNVKQPDILKTIMEQKKKRDSKKLIGIYFDGEVADALDKIGRKGGRGAKSQVVNDVLKDFFKEQGLLK